MKKGYEGICAICGEFKKLSFEHVPPQSAFNDKPIFVQNADHLTNRNSPSYGNKILSNRGLGGFTLCESCNNNTGDWYARDFAEFANQGMKIISKIKIPRYDIAGIYLIKPLNVIKQILAMFMSADKIGHLRSQKELVNFIMDRETVGLPEKYKIFIYSTLSPKKRMMGYQIFFTPQMGVQHWSEINFQPFGYLLAEDSVAAHKDMCDISNFGNFKYNQKVEVKMTTPYLNIESPFIGTYN